MNGRFLKKNVVLVAVIIGVLLISGAATFNILKNDDATIETLGVNNDLEKIVTQTVSADSDGDGLKDWEEALLETNPQNSDTDGDGTNDKDEIDQGRDPLVSGPDDVIESIVTPSTNASASITEDRAVTEDLAIKLFTGYIELKKSGNLNTTSSDQLITAVINESTKNTNTKSYTVEDINVIENPSIEEISKYDDQLTSILIPDTSIENDLVVLKRILETKNTDALVVFDTSIKYYERVVAEMLSLDVPEPIATEYITAVSALARVIENVKGMKTVFTDPLGALVNVKEYDNNENIFLQNLLNIGKYLNLNRLSNE